MLATHFYEGGKGEGLVTKSRRSLSNFTNHEKDNFIFTISCALHVSTGFIECTMGFLRVKMIQMKRKANVLIF